MNYYKNYLKYSNKLLKLNKQLGGCELLGVPLDQLVEIDYNDFLDSRNIHQFNVVVSDGITKECWNHANNNKDNNTYKLNDSEIPYNMLKFYIHRSVNLRIKNYLNNDKIINNTIVDNNIKK